MSNPLTIKIPYELARYAVWQRSKHGSKGVYSTNQVIKALDTWLVLKAEAPGSFIQHWNVQKDQLFQLCKVSETIFRHRLKVLQQMKLITVCRQHIRLASWDQLAAILSIDISKKLTIQYDPTNKQKLHQWLIAAEIEDNQNRQAYMVMIKVKKNPELNLKFTAALLKYGADRNRIDDPLYFHSMLKALYWEDFKQASDIHNDLITVRPDTDRGVRAMAAAWTTKGNEVHPTTISYWKKILQQTGIVEVSKLTIESESRVRNEFCHVIWGDTPNIRKKYPAKLKQQTVFPLPDRISLLQPWAASSYMIAA